MLSHLSLVWLFVTLAFQAPLSVGFSRKEYWSGLSHPPPGDLPDPGTETTSPASPSLQADFLPLSHLASIHWGMEMSSYLPRITETVSGQSWNLRSVCLSLALYHHTIVLLLLPLPSRCGNGEPGKSREAWIQTQVSRFHYAMWSPFSYCLNFLLSSCINFQIYKKILGRKWKIFYSFTSSLSKLVLGSAICKLFEILQ